ncbi:MAG: hypothetical protein R3A51_12360 [Nannocystaceae bacterium]|nr:hypothetical protein [Myxococcales bacterium]
MPTITYTLYESDRTQIAQTSASPTLTVESDGTCTYSSTTVDTIEIEASDDYNSAVEIYHSWSSGTTIDPPEMDDETEAPYAFYTSTGTYSATMTFSQPADASNLEEEGINSAIVHTWELTGTAVGGAVRLKYKVKVKKVAVPHSQN